MTTARRDRVPADHAEQRREFRRQLAATPDSAIVLRRAAAVLAHPPEWARGWTVFAVLVAVPAMSTAAVYAALIASRIPVDTEVAQCTPVERHAVCAWLEDRAANRAVSA